MRSTSVLLLSATLGLAGVPAAARAHQAFTVERVPVSHLSGGDVVIDDRRGLALVADRYAAANPPPQPSVSVVDVRRQRQVGSISLAAAAPVDIGGVLVPHVPSGLDADVRRGLVVTTNSAAGSVAVMGVRGAAADPRDFVRVGAHPYGVAVDEARGLAYVSSYGEHRIDVVDVRRREVVDAIGGVRAPTRLALDARRGRLYVGNADRSTDARHEMAVIDTRRRIVLGAVAVDANSRPAVDEASGAVYAASFATGRVVRFAPGAALTPRAAVETATTPHGLGVDPRRRLLYAPNLQAGTVTVLDAATLAVRATLSVPGVPLGVDVDARSGRAWISLRDASALAVIEPR